MAIGRLPLQFHLFDQEDTLSERVCGAVKSLCSLHVDNPMIELIICSEPIQDVGQFGGEMRSAHGRRPTLYKVQGTRVCDIVSLAREQASTSRVECSLHSP